MVRARPVARYGAFGQQLHCLVYDGQADAAAATLAEIGAAFGFSAACALLARMPAAFAAPVAEPLAAVLLELARTDDPNADAEQCRSARAAVLAQVDEGELWADVRNAIEATLVAA